MTKRGRFRRHPAVLIFGGNAKRWKRRAELAGFGNTAIELMDFGMFANLSDEDQNEILALSGKTADELCQDYKLYIEEREEVQKERRDARKDRRVKLYGRGGYPAGDDIEESEDTL